MARETTQMFGGVFARVNKPVIGMVHLPALPGSPGYMRSADRRGGMDAILARAVADARVLAENGVHGLMLENFGDVPFFAGQVPAATVAHMTALAMAVRETAPDLPLGINVLRNDGRSALAIAGAVGAAFIRVNVLHGAVLADQGIIQGEAAVLMRDRVMLDAGSVRVFADIQVKHAAALADWPIEAQVAESLHRCLADALIVTGEATGRPTDMTLLRQVKQAAGGAAVLVGSGVTIESVQRLAEHADGFIVGTHFKQGGDVAAPVDAARVRALLGRLDQA